MSMWTHITACLSVETGLVRKKVDLKRELQKELRHAPKITGSERDADIYVNVQSGYNFWMSHDCDHCKYKDTRVEYEDEDGDTCVKCDAPDRHNCSGEYQTCVTISIQGDLRDRTQTETQKEFDKFLDYVKKHYHVRDYAVNIDYE